MIKQINTFMEDNTAKGDSEIISRIIGIVFGVYIVAYALTTAVLALINATGFNQTEGRSATVYPIITLTAIIIVFGIAWMFFRQMTKGK